MTPIKSLSPINNDVIVTRELATGAHIENVLIQSKNAQQAWQKVALKDKAKMLNTAIDFMVANKAKLAKEICLQMGRPIRYCEGEINGLAERGRHMITIAPDELDDISIASEPGKMRKISKEPLGTVLTIAPWNYPYLTAVNSIIPALMAGNTVILKHSAQTLLCAERFYEAFEHAGVPQGVFQYLHIDHDQTAQIIQDNRINYVSFTGSVAGGKAIEQAAVGQFMGVALELGGKDPAYVREDADIAFAAEQIVDGTMFNSGQSCCGIERVYVHHSIHEQFVEQVVKVVNQYVLGDPQNPDTTLGPMVSAKAADFVRKQIDDAINSGAKAHIDMNHTQDQAQDKKGSPYLAPQVLTEVNHKMSVAKDESFGPVMPIIKVSDDKQAIELMNDSEFGLTASIWTKDAQAAQSIAEQIDTGTVFMNRCDYLDPALPWVGIKHSGRGCALSALGYQQLTRPKSFNFNL